jgi:uroporphyrinogen decarboxylase
MTDDEYAIFGRPYDLRFWRRRRAAWLTVLHLHGDDVMFDLLSDYPVQVWNWHDQRRPTLAEAKRKVLSAVLGGLRQWETLLRGDPDQVAGGAGGDRANAWAWLRLGHGCVTPIPPWSNRERTRGRRAHQP